MEKTLHDLEWARVVAAVRARCVGPGAERDDVPIAVTAEGARRALGETAEARALLDGGEPLPLDGLKDLGDHLRRLSREGALDGPALRDVASTLGAAGALRRFLSRVKSRAPRLVEACSTDPTLDVLHDELTSAVGPDGTLADHASPELRRLRTEIANLRGRLVARLEEMIHKQADLLSDRFYTIREGRYVLPLRTDAHERIPGIVHATSASGATVFIEPRSLIAQGNRLKMAQAELSREEARIFAILSDLVRERLPEVGAAADALDHADLRSACARFGRDLGAPVPVLADSPRIALRAARHPVLLLDGAEVVANDLSLEAGQGLVLSGPNAGGKTVALKVLGLAALMTRAGLPVPAAEGSECGFFDPVLSDVGDEQSLEKNLSTFSAHITNIVRILEQSRPGALVLLDEVAGGTDPEEGAALACALVDVLCRRGAAVAVTTHYESLKALALRDARLRNASVGFDVARLEPTFELRMDVPGSSSALAVASRFGMPREVVELAERVLPEQSRTFDELVRRLEEQRQAAEIERTGLEEEARAVQVTRERLDVELAAARSRDRARVDKEVERLLSAIRRARDDVREARRTLRQKRLAPEQVSEARRRLDEAARTARAAKAEAEPAEAPSEGQGPLLAPEELEPGMRVWVPRLKAVAEVVESPSRGRVRVAAGPVKLVVDASDLRAAPAAAEAKPRERAARAGGTRRAAVRTADNTLDVRGLRVDEAVGMMESFLDRLYGADEAAVFILHGHGTGALREALRKRLLADAHYVAGVRVGSREEGGDGVTVVLLR